MNNLFSIFDPATSFNLAMNWSAVIIFFPLMTSIFKSSPLSVGYGRNSLLSIMVMKTLHYEFSMPMNNKILPYKVQIFLYLFLVVCVMNFMGLTPYTFTPSSSISLSVCLAITIWMFIEISFFFMALSSFLSHLVPSGTPGPLIPLMVLIELVSNFIRPITLSVRLAANMVAGHLLISLVNSGSLNFSALLFMLSGGVTLFFLEVAVAFIQGYVFSTLSIMYISEFNATMEI